MEDCDIQTQNQALIKWLGAGSINLFGRPFSGKDTQANVLSRLFNAPILGGGDIIRNSGNQTMNNYVGEGLLTPQKEYLAMILPYLSKPDYNNKPLILSSLGRWHGEEKSIMHSAKQSGHPIKAVIHLEIDEDSVLERWKVAKHLNDRGTRNDDNPTSIETRLNEFKTKTLPVLEFYKQRGLLITIDGTQKRENVTKDILYNLTLNIENP